MYKVKSSLENAGYDVDDCDVEFVPLKTASVDERLQKMLTLAVEKTEELDDVVKTYINVQLWNGVLELIRDLISIGVALSLTNANIAAEKVRMNFHTKLPQHKYMYCWYK